MNTRRLEADSDAVGAAFMSELHELDRFRFFGCDNLSRGQKRQLLSTLPKDFVLCRDRKIELRFKLPVNDKRVADTIATLSSNNVLYDRLDLIGHVSPVWKFNSPGRKEQLSRRWR